MTSLTAPTIAALTTLSLAALSVMTAPASAEELSADYQFPFQFPVGLPATFNTIGPATGDTPNPQGDAIISSVTMATGDRFAHFYKPIDIANVQFTGDASQWMLTAGTDCTVGLIDMSVKVSEPDGNAGDVSTADLEIFGDLILSAFQTNNLNNYVDCYDSTVRFSFVIKFDRMVMDNDEDPDAFGEILYFERGAGNGNSWLKVRAVEEDGTPMGPWLVISPSETVQTYPVTTVLNPSQKMGTVAIDVSRLGVTEFQYMEVSNDLPGEPAYTGGGDLNPDFKFMVVITNEQQLRSIMYD